MAQIATVAAIAGQQVISQRAACGDVGAPAVSSCRHQAASPAWEAVTAITAARREIVWRAWTARAASATRAALAHGHVGASVAGEQAMNAAAASALTAVRIRKSSGMRPRCAGGGRARRAFA